MPDNPQPVHLQPESIWLLDKIVSRSAGTELALRRDGAGFRLDENGPYLRLHFVSIYVSDQERSLRFFVDQLGFVLVSDAQFASGAAGSRSLPPMAPRSLRW